MSERRAQIHEDHALSKRRRCQLLAVARSTAYYRPGFLDDEDLALMRLIDEIHLQWPFYGSRRIRDELQERGQRVNRKRVQRLMHQMGLQALYPRRRTSQPGKGHKIYPYLLRDLVIARSNQVWAADICYLPMAKGFMYLVAIMDWHSRRVLSWRVSNTLDTDFCLDALQEALRLFGAPEIFNTEVPSSPRRHSPAHSRTRASRSAWMARAGGWTTCSSNGCGAVSSTRTCTCVPTKPRRSSGQG
jgi:putative transposase